MMTSLSMTTATSQSPARRAAVLMPAAAVEEAGDVVALDERPVAEALVPPRPAPQPQLVARAVVLAARHEDDRLHGAATAGADALGGDDGGVGGGAAVEDGPLHLDDRQLEVEVVGHDAHGPLDLAVALHDDREAVGVEDHAVGLLVLLAHDGHDAGGQVGKVAKVRIGRAEAARGRARLRRLLERDAVRVDHQVPTVAARRQRRMASRWLRMGVAGLAVGLGPGTDRDGGQARVVGEVGLDQLEGDAVALGGLGQRACR